MKLILIFCLLICTVFGKHEQYEGHVVYEVYPKSIDEMILLNNFVNKQGLDIWAFATLNNAGEIFVSKSQKETFESFLKSADIAYKPTVENIKELLDEADLKLSANMKRNRKPTELTFDHVYSNEEVNEYLAAMAAEYPYVANLTIAGHSVEGRPIRTLEISTTGFQDVGKPIIFLQALLHAREWVTLAPVLYAIEKLLTDLKYTELLNNIDWIIMPVANPDGYEWSRTDDRFWRKNRRTGLTANDRCVGVDLNRNFDIDWSTLSSWDPCTTTYHGWRPTSEPETLAIANTFAKYAGRITMYEDIHSAGSMILYGWGNGTLVPNALMLNYACVKMSQAIDAVKWSEKPNYQCGDTLSVIGYMVSGGSSDYAQSLAVPYSYTYELPAHLGAVGVNRFLVSQEFIKQAALETWDGFVAGANHLLGL